MSFCNSGSHGQSADRPVRASQHRKVLWHQRIYISDRTHSTPLRLPKMCLTQPLPALSSIHRVHHSNYLTVWQSWGGIFSQLGTGSYGTGWPSVGPGSIHLAPVPMTEDYTKIGTALARGELAREPVPISTEDSTSGGEVGWDTFLEDAAGYCAFYH